MKVVGLDQNAISGLVRRAGNPFWCDLREALITGVEDGKLLCPLRKKTVAETIPCTRDIRLQIRDLQMRLSAGFSFKTFGTIEDEETLALVKSSLRPFPYERGGRHSVEDDCLRIPTPR